MEANEKLAAHNCDREPVHIPGRIQPFGSMLAFDLQTNLVTHHSDNLGQTLGHLENRFIDAPYAEVLNHREVLHGVRGALSLPTIRRQRDRIGNFPIDGALMDVSVYATDEFGVVELEPIESVNKPQSPVSMVRAMMSTVQEGEGVQKLLETSVRALRHLTGHDRIMAYRFLENGDGEVVSEAKGPGIEPFLGLRYPAWDIPTQVRQIMLRAPFRVIRDIKAEHCALVQHADTQPLDMTLSHLRGVSPIHVEYLSNMGVRATMNTSLIVHGGLWGLFAFHHYRPRHLTPDERSICELFGQLISMMLQKEIEQAKLTSRQRSQSTLAAIDDEHEGIESIMDRMSSAFMEVIPSDGMCLCHSGEYRNYGNTPSIDFTRWLIEYSSVEILAIDSLQTLSGYSDAKGDLDELAGALVVRLQQDTVLIFFRNEVIHSVRWAGNRDEKEISFGPNGPRLSPRGSFAEYKESVSGRCTPWTEEDVAAAGDICRQLWKALQVDMKEQSRVLERQKQYQDLLIAELNHRVRNTLALVRSIARQTQASSGSLEQYVELLESRIAALSSAHDLVGGSGLQWARIHDLVATELKPFRIESQKVSIDGPKLAVRADMAPILALLFHELVSNAVKHGAFSPQGRQLDVRWYDDAGGIAIDWIETLQAAILEPNNRGFGLSLIERALPYECNGRSKIKFEGNTLRVQFWLPADAVNRPEDSEVASVRDPMGSRNVSMDLGSHFESALVVEDNLVLAMEVEQLLLDLGIKSIETVPSVEAAQAATERATFDCAVMDINLGNETSFEIATKLKAAGASVVLASGYDSKFDIPDSLRSLPRIVKPVTKVSLFNAISRALEVD